MAIKRESGDKETLKRMGNHREGERDREGDEEEEEQWIDLAV